MYIYIYISFSNIRTLLGTNYYDGTFGITVRRMIFFVKRILTSSASNVGYPRTVEAWFIILLFKILAPTGGMPTYPLRCASFYLPMYRG
jgi:hypothetical protein